MESSKSSTSGRPGASSDQADRIKHLPPAARDAFQRIQTAGDLSGINLVVFAILEDYIPNRPATPLAELPGRTRLVDDLGFDSLAITEVVFFTEDLFGISITNEEIIRVRTLDDLQGFIQGKLAGRTPR